MIERVGRYMKEEVPERFISGLRPASKKAKTVKKKKVKVDKKLKAAKQKKVAKKKKKAAKPDSK